MSNQIIFCYHIECFCSNRMKLLFRYDLIRFGQKPEWNKQGTMMIKSKIFTKWDRKRHWQTSLTSCWTTPSSWGLQISQWQNFKMTAGMLLYRIVHWIESISNRKVSFYKLWIEMKKFWSFEFSIKNPLAKGVRKRRSDLPRKMYWKIFLWITDFSQIVISHADGKSVELIAVVSLWVFRATDLWRTFAPCRGAPSVSRRYRIAGRRPGVLGLHRRAWWSSAY